MLLNTALLSAAAVSFFPGPVLAAPSPPSVVDPIYLENGDVEFRGDYVGEDNILIKRKVQLTSFKGCTDVQQFNIVNAWQTMLNMADKIKDKVNFDEEVAVDFLGHPTRNKDRQKDIKAMIQSVATWQLGGVFDWSLRTVCNDPNWVARTMGSTDRAEGCPKGTKEDDYPKCMSRCWKAIKNSDGSVRSWTYGSTAYTDNYPGTLVGSINFCPAWFAARSCNDAFSKYSKSSGDDKFDMTNYQCREQSLVHELFHIDANWKHHAAGVGHVSDRSIKFFDKDLRQSVTRKAYGPLYTKVLARWTKDVGHFVVTNADNLAFYFLGKWILEHGGFYPSRPLANAKPSQNPDKRKRQATGDEAIEIIDNQIALGDLDDLAGALGVPEEEAKELYAVGDGELECTDLVSEGENDVGECYPAEPALELDASIEQPDVEKPEPSCVYTVTSMVGVTEEAYTLEPTVATMCICDETVQAAISTGTNEAKTSYLVCLTDPQVTISTMDPPPPTEAPPPPPPEEKPKPTQDCSACGNTLGASNCPAEDNQCLVDQCKSDKDCIACQFDCDQFK